MFALVRLCLAHGAHPQRCQCAKRRGPGHLENRDWKTKLGMAGVCIAFLFFFLRVRACRCSSSLGSCLPTDRMMSVRLHRSADSR